MGNRAVITAAGSESGIYVHWNGGRESVEAFLRAAKDLGVRDPDDDSSYFHARLAQIIANWMGGTASVGIGALSELDTDNGDNGVFVVGAGFEIAPRNDANLTAAEKKRSNDIYNAVMKVNQPIFKPTAAIA
jgi:hypothetical protein